MCLGLFDEDATRQGLSGLVTSIFEGDAQASVARFAMTILDNILVNAVQPAVDALINTFFSQAEVGADIANTTATTANTSTIALNTSLITTQNAIMTGLTTALVANTTAVGTSSILSLIHISEPTRPY